MKTPLESILWVFLASFWARSRRLSEMGRGAACSSIGRTLVYNWRLGVGVAMYLISFVFYYLGLRQGELSILFPMVSLGYIWTLLWSRLFSASR